MNYLENTKTISEMILESLRVVENYPTQGSVSFDTASLVCNADLFKKIITHLANRYKSYNLDYVIGIESKGFLFGSALASALNIGFIPIRKEGKTPPPFLFQEYKRTTKWITMIKTMGDIKVGQKRAIEYEIKRFEMSNTFFQENSNKNVILIDDLISSGDTIFGAINLLKQKNITIKEVCCIVEYTFSDGFSKLKKNYPSYSISKI